MSSWPFGLSTGQFWGAVGGTIGGVILLALVAFYFYKRHYSSSSYQQEEQYFTVSQDVGYGSIGGRKDDTYVQLDEDLRDNVRLIAKEDKKSRVFSIVQEEDDEEKIAWTNIEPNDSVESQLDNNPISSLDSIKRKGKTRKNKKLLPQNEESSPITSPLTSPLHQGPQSLASLIASTENEKLKHFGGPSKKKSNENNQSRLDELVEIPLLPPPIDISFDELDHSTVPQYHPNSLPPPILSHVTENPTIVLEEEALSLKETTTFNNKSLLKPAETKFSHLTFDNSSTPVRTSPSNTNARTSPLPSNPTPIVTNSLLPSTTIVSPRALSSPYQVNPNHIPHPVNASLLTSSYGKDDDSDPSWSDEDSIGSSKSSRSSYSSASSSYMSDSDTEDIYPVSPRAKRLPIPVKKTSSSLSSSDNDMPPSDLPPTYLPPPVDFLAANNYQDNTQSFIDIPPPSDLPPLFLDDLPPPSDLPPQLDVETKKKNDIWAKRWNIAQEILETEMSFNLGLKLIDSQFYQPLLTSNTVDISLVNSIFPQSLQTVILISDQFLEILRSKLANQIGETVVLGEAFILLAPLLRNHSPYVNNYIDSYNTYTFCQRNYPKFQEFVSNPKRSNIFVENILITVIQRSPRYVLFIRDLLKVTPPSHPDYSLLQQAERVVVDSVTYINEQKRIFDQQKYSIALQMEFKIPIDHTRSLIHEEKVWKQPNESGADIPETYKFVIFSDFILLVKFQDGIVVKGKKYPFNRHSLRILKDCVATAFEYHNETYFTEKADMRLKLIQVCRKNGINVYIEGESTSEAQAAVITTKSPRSLPNVPNRSSNRREGKDETLKRTMSQKSVELASSVGEAKEKASDILKIGSEKAGKTAEDLLKKGKQATSSGTVSKKVKKKSKNLLGGIF